MATGRPQPTRKAVWDIAERQYDRVTVEQLQTLGMTRSAIRHRVGTGKLFPVAPRVLAISRPRGTDEERWMTAFLVTGAESVIGGASALFLMRLAKERDRVTEVCVPNTCHRRPSGLIVHRRAFVLPAERRVHRLIPVTSPALTIIDNAPTLGEEGVEAAINEASQRDLASPDTVRRTAERYPRIPGSKLVRTVLDRDLFELTDTELERVFRRLLRRFGLPLALPQRWVNGFRVDFFWPDLGLIVECDSLRYHRTAAKQRSDAEKDQVHTAAGLTTMRFTHWQIQHEPHVVAERLAPVMERLSRARTPELPRVSGA